ncbi:TetR/AcrR family transcriptional regulator [Streptomyces sp. NPDC127098]|uniref:TetR/AcrR family transcriptional regulator n=1 Tax=Streptomyces sp. NPDC127098 TaxID=3347137 RepID=UPI00365F07D6
MAARRPYAKGEAKRAEIVDVALELFSRKGYDRTSFREVARLVNLSQAGLLHYFRTKEDLFVEVLRRRDERNTRFYDQTVDRDVTVEGLIEIIKHNAVEPGLVRLYVAMSAESTDAASSARQFFVRRYEMLRANIAADIRRKQAAGELPDALDPQTTASLVMAAADGLQLQWLLDPEQVDMGAMLEELVTLLRGTPTSPSPEA